MNKPSQYKTFHNGKLFRYRETLNFHAQTRIVQLCLIFYSYPATVIAMHLQEAFFFTAILVLMQAEHHNIKVKVVQIEKALNLPQYANAIAQHMGSCCCQEEKVNQEREP